MNKKKIFNMLPLMAGVLLVLLPIFTLMTIERLKRQNELFSQRVLEKGVSLIRTFEAGTRTGMFTMRWGAQKIQDMLRETSLQPEVVYMMITSKEGRILAHSKVARVGESFEAMPDISKINPDPLLVHHRIRNARGETEVLEVFKPFAPARRRFRHGPGWMRRMALHPGEMDMGRMAPGERNKDWSRYYMQERETKGADSPEHYIFAGLSMKRSAIARSKLLKTTVWQGVFFFLLGCTGMAALFAFQAYRSAKASLSSVKAFSNSVIQNMPSGLVTMNMDHDITSMNTAAKEILGGTPDRPFPQLIDVAKAVRKSHGDINQEITITTESNRSIDLDITGSIVRTREDNITGYLFLFRDLTQIRELKKQVETNKRLAAIGKLAAGVAHEIRNPLSSIKGFATYFGKRYEKNETDKETAHIMVSEVERINRSITQLLEFAKPMAIEKKEVDIEKLILHSLKLVQHDLDQKKIKTVIDTGLENKKVYTDGDRINQVLLNLYINAIEALEPGQKLEVRVAGATQADMLEITVRDNGAGIEKASLDRIFDPYFTTRPTGTGLGLSIVHRIVENLGGSIRVKSSKGEGTCFYILLPLG